MSLPTGTLTFLFTDIESSTRLWEAYPEPMRAAVARHDVIVRQAVTDNNGHVFKTTGDGVIAVFAIASDAIAAALAAQRSLQAEPWLEEAPIRSRMGLHTGAAELRDGDYFGATLSRCARLMAAGHGEQTLLSEVTHELTRDSLLPDVSLIPLGEHRLKDLARPETVYQLGHPALAAEFPRLRTLDVTPNNVPQQVTSFIGRESAIADVLSRLDKTHLLTLTGAGGAGKTRLSLQAAADVLDQYPDGVWLIELAPIVDPTLVPQTIASVLNIKEQGGQTLTQTLIGALKDKKALLLLDNCEHLVYACAQFVATLIRGCPNITVLATSREALGISGEVLYRVPSLSLPDPKASQTATPENLTQFESVRLFIERAQAVRLEFSVTNQSAPALAQICYRLDGIPLAIELAAARVRSLSVEQINDKLDSRFRLLTGGDRSALPRQQTLRALIDWGYDLLTETEKTLLARISVFSGGWTLAAAEAVCAGESASPGFEPIEDFEVLDLLTSLADKSLILSEEITGEQETRYRILETIRQYAAERLTASGEEATVRERHARFFVEFAGEAVPHLKSPDQRVWLNRLETEHDNFRAALAACTEAPRSAGSAATARNALLARFALQLAGTLSRFWRVRGYVTEGREHLAQALAGRQAVESDTADGMPPEPVNQMLAAALCGAGELVAAQNDYSAALSLFEESLPLYKGLGDKRGIAQVLQNFGFIAYIHGDHAAARSRYDESLALYRALGDKHGMADTVRRLGDIAYSEGDYVTAGSVYDEVLVLCREIGTTQSVATARHSLGHVACSLGDYPAARAHYQESLVLSREMGDKLGIANGLNRLAYVASLQGDYKAARSLYEDSLVLYRELGSKHGIANARNNLGNIAFKQGDYAAARPLLEDSVILYREIGNKFGIAVALNHLGNVVSSQGDFAAALSTYRESLGLFREIANKHGVVEALNGLARTYAGIKGEGHLHLAPTLWAAANTLQQSLGIPDEPNTGEQRDAELTQARANLDDEAAWAAARAEGATLSWEEAVELALR